MRNALLGNTYLRPQHYLMKVSRNFMPSPVYSQFEAAPPMRALLLSRFWTNQAVLQLVISRHF